MNYSHLTTVQKFDAIARLSRATSQFCKPLELQVTTTENVVKLSWIASHKGIVSYNPVTEEIIDAKDFTSVITVKVSLLTLSVGYELSCDTEGKLQSAIATKYLQGVRNVLDNVDLSPLTRTRKTTTNEDVQ